MKNYEGTILFVSHDRYFINKIANKVLDITDNGHNIYLGNYDYYLEKREQERIAQQLTKQNEEVVVEKEANNYILDKETKRRVRKLERTRDELMNKIETLEEKIQDVNNELAREEVYTDMIKTQEFNEQLKQLNSELEELNDSWLEIEEELECING